MLNKRDDLVDAVTIVLSTSASILTSDGLESAADMAMAELHQSFPVNDAFLQMWVIKRAVRHASYILLVAAAQKFKYKQVNLNQRFDHYTELIKLMDTEFEKAYRDNISLFANVDAYKMFGTAVGAGFVYDYIGRDFTYTELTRFIASGD